MATTASWSSEAQQYLENYLEQVSALLQTQHEDPSETLEELQQHIIHKVEETAGPIVSLADIRYVVADVGTPEQVAGGGLHWSVNSTAKRRVVLQQSRFDWFASLPWKFITILAIVIIMAHLVLYATMAVVNRQDTSLESPGGFPQGWFQAGNNHQDFVTGLAYGLDDYSTPPLFIRSITSKPKGFSTVMTEIPASDFRGHQVTLHSIIKSHNINGWAGLWLRIDDAANQPLGFDNMQNRPIRGNVGPSEYKVVLDVPETASKIAYGVLLEGEGHIWFDTPEVTVTR